MSRRTSFTLASLCGLPRLPGPIQGSSGVGLRLRGAWLMALRNGEKIMDRNIHQ
jgi:hypothetical protein